MTFELERGGVCLRGDWWPADDDRRSPGVTGPLVFLHGGGQTRHSWSSSARQAAAAGWPALTMDARGHGDSGWDPGGDYTIGTMADDVVAVVEELAALDARPPILVGASMGGLATLLAAGRHPEICRAAVIVDVVPRMDPEGTQRIADFMLAHQDGFETLEQAADAVAAYNPNRPRPADPSGLSKNLRQDADGRWRWHWDPAFLFGLDFDPGKSGLEEVRSAMRDITAPVLLVDGLNSDIVDEAGIADALDLMPHARRASVAGAGHMVVGDDNAGFVGAIAPFLLGLG
jgi:non-heme chloroperoxidase